MSKIRTVLGDIFPDKLGLTLVHEHVLVDFVGAETFSKERYDAKRIWSITYRLLVAERGSSMTV